AVWLSQFLGRILDDPRPAYTRMGQFPGMQWVHVNDLTSALVQAGRHSAPLNHIINVAGGELFSVFDLLSIADKALRSRSRFDVFSSWGRVGASNRLKFDISLAEQLLDYAPQITLKQGIE